MKRYFARVLLYGVVGATVLAVIGCDVSRILGATPTARITVVSTTLEVGKPATLNGTDSSDPDGRSLSYEWKLTGQPPGSQASIGSPFSAIATITPDLEGAYAIELTVTAGSNTHSTQISLTAAAGEDDETPDTDSGVLGWNVAGSGTLYFDNDTHTLVLNVPESGVLWVVALFSHAAGDIDIELYGPGDVFIASGSSITDDEVITTPVTAGTYEVDVYLYGDATNTALGVTYELRWALE